MGGQPSRAEGEGEGGEGAAGGERDQQRQPGVEVGEMALENEAAGSRQQETTGGMYGGRRSAPPPPPLFRFVALLHVLSCTATGMYPYPRRRPILVCSLLPSTLAGFEASRVLVRWLSFGVW